MIQLNKYTNLSKMSLLRSLLIIGVLLMTPLMGFYVQFSSIAILALVLILLVFLKPLWLMFLILLLLPMDNYLPIFQIPVLHVAATSVNCLALGATISLVIQFMRKRIRFRWSTSHKLFTGFVAINFLLIWYAVDSREAFVRSINWLLFLGLYLALYQYLENLPTLRYGMLLYALAGCFIVSTGLFQSMVQISGSRVDGLLGNPNSFATAIIACSLGVLLCSIDVKREKGYLPIIPIIYLSLGFVAVLLSASRGGLLGLSLVIVGISLWGRSRATIAISLIVGLALFLTSTLWPGLFEPVISRIASEETYSLGGRLKVWDISISLIRERPWLGYGAGSASDLVGEVFYSGQRTVSTTKSIHNPLLEVLIENGLVGTVFYALMILLPTGRIVKTLFQDSRSLPFTVKTLYSTFLSAFVGYLSVWIKNGGSTYDKNLFVFLTVALILHDGIGNKIGRGNE